MMRGSMIQVPCLPGLIAELLAGLIIELTAAGFLPVPLRHLPSPSENRPGHSPQGLSRWPSSTTRRFASAARCTVAVLPGPVVLFSHSDAGGVRAAQRLARGAAQHEADRPARVALYHAIGTTRDGCVCGRWRAALFDLRATGVGLFVASPFLSIPFVSHPFISHQSKKWCPQQKQVPSE